MQTDIQTDRQTDRQGHGSIPAYIVCVDKVKPIVSSKNWQQDTI